MVSLTVLRCPVCGAPIQPNEFRCSYCGSVVVIQTDHPKLDPQLIDKAVVDERIAEFRQTLRTDPNNVAAHYGLGVAYFNLRLLEEAAEELKQAARLMPENPHIQTQLAVVLAEPRSTHDPAREREAWDRVERALTLNPHHVDALRLKSTLLRRRGDVTGAVAVLHQAAVTDPAAKRQLAQHLIDDLDQVVANRQYGQAMTALRDAAAIDPEAVRPWLGQFLTRHATLIKNERFPQEPLIGREAKPRWVLKAIGLAALSMVVMFVIAVVFAGLTPDGVDGTADISDWRGIAAIICTLGIGIAPIVVIIVCYRRSRRVPTPRPLSGARSAGALIADPQAPVSDLLAAANAVMLRLKHPGRAYAKRPWKEPVPRGARPPAPGDVTDA